MRKMKVLAATVALAACALVVGCSLLGGSSLDGTSWRLTGWSLSSIDPNNFTITATFDNGEIGGTSAVNSYGGSYKTGPGGSFSVDQIVSTLMAGSDEAMAAESAYFLLLNSAASYEVADNHLTLFDENGNESLIFESVPAE